MGTLKIRSLKLIDPPPSVNNATVPIRRKLKSGAFEIVKVSSKDYAAWMTHAQYQLNSQTGLPDECYWRADIMVPAAKTAADLDNMAKGIFDALHKSKKSPDDRYLVDLRLRWWEGDHVAILLAEEDATKWGPIRAASEKLIAKLSQTSLFGGQT
jgi:Holliday junction resolvase RusA-like endonuclease